LSTGKYPVEGEFNEFNELSGINKKIERHRRE
jgi:hypothetical protein